jgi:hypothetical protein
VGRSTVTIELGGNALLPRELAAGGVFIPGCTLRIAEECELVVCGVDRRVSLPARVVYVDEKRGAGLELIGFTTAIREQLAELAPIAGQVRIARGSNTPAPPPAIAPAAAPRPELHADDDLALPTACNVEISGTGDDALLGAQIDAELDAELDAAFADPGDDLAVPLDPLELVNTLPIPAPRRVNDDGGFFDIVYPDNGFTADDAAAELGDDFDEDRGSDGAPLVVQRGDDGDDFDAADPLGREVSGVAFADGDAAGGGEGFDDDRGAGIHSGFAAGDAAALGNDFSDDAGDGFGDDFSDVGPVSAASGFAAGDAARMIDDFADGDAAVSSAFAAADAASTSNDFDRDDRVVDPVSAAVDRLIVGPAPAGGPTSDAAAASAGRGPRSSARFSAVEIPPAASEFTEEEPVAMLARRRAPSPGVLLARVAVGPSGARAAVAADDAIDGDPVPEPEAQGLADGSIDPNARRSARAPLHVHERLRGMTLAAQIKLAAAGELNERIVLERLYGKNVWETLLRNPRLTAPEVARIARYGSLPRVLLDQILANGAWLQVPEVRRALLANPRLGTDQIVKVLRMTPKHELRLAAIQTAYPHAVRNAAKMLLRGD